MRGLTVAIIILALITFTASASALSMPSLFGSLASFPVLSTNINPVNTFSLGTDGGSSSTSSTPTIPVIIGNPSNPIQNLPVGFDSSFQWPGVGYDKWTAPHSTAPIDPVSASYFNAPALTQAQKDEAVKIASTSPLCKEYNTYPNDGDVSWGYPYDGHTADVIFDTGSQGSSTWGQISLSVDLDSGTVMNSSYLDHNKYL